MNIVVLRGALASQPAQRAIDDHTTMWSFDVKTTTDSGTYGCPVTTVNPRFDPAAWPLGTELVVCGSIRKRFFRIGVTTQSRTEVVAETVVPSSRRKAAQAAIAKAVAACNAE